MNSQFLLSICSIIRAGKSLDSVLSVDCQTINENFTIHCIYFKIWRQSKICHVPVLKIPEKQVGRSVLNFVGFIKSQQIPTDQFHNSAKTSAAIFIFILLFLKSSDMSAHNL